MKTQSYHHLLIRSCSWAAFLLLSASLADAGIRERSGSFQGARGNSGTWNSTAERGQGFRIMERSATGANGRSWGHQRESLWDRETGSGSRSWSRTGPGGQTASGQSNVERTETGATYDRSRTNRDGSTASSTGTMTKNDDGSRSYETEWTNREGNTATSTRTVTKTEDGREITGTATGYQGNTQDWTTTVQREDGTRTTTTEVSNAGRRDPESGRNPDPR
jgi:hypothetical protein